jgi:hypothetical protein
MMAYTFVPIIATGLHSWWFRSSTRARGYHRRISHAAACLERSRAANARRFYAYRNVTRLLIGGGLTVISASCAFTVPSARTATVWKIGVEANEAESIVAVPGRWVYSPSAKLMAAAVTDPIEKGVMLDEARRCEGRMSALVAKIRSERNGRATVTLLGGGIGAASGIASAALDPELGTAKTITASVAAAGAIIALLNQVIGEPAVETEAYYKAVSHYEQAVNMAFVGATECAKIQCTQPVRRELALCNDPVASAEK